CCRRPHAYAARRPRVPRAQTASALRSRAPPRRQRLRSESPSSSLHTEHRRVHVANVRRVAPIVLEQRAARPAGALRRMVTETARHAFEIAAFLIEIGNRPVLDDAQSAREAMQELPAAAKDLSVVGVEQTQPRQSLEVYGDAVDQQQLGMLAPV